MIYLFYKEKFKKKVNNIMNSSEMSRTAKFGEILRFFKRLLTCHCDSPKKVNLLVVFVLSTHFL